MCGHGETYLIGNFLTSPTPLEGNPFKRYHQTSDSIHLNPETLGWDWRTHFGRPRQFGTPHPRGG